MKKITIHFFLLLFTVINIVSCKKKEFKKVNPEFINYVSAYTSGLISSKSSIKVKLSKANTEIKTGDDATHLFKIDPQIEGNAQWLSANTIEFTPLKPLPSGELYDINFALSKVMEVPKTLKEFIFSVQVIPQNFDVKLKTVKSFDLTNLNLQKVEGSIKTADVIEINELAQIFTSTLNGKKYSVRLNKGNNAKSFKFHIDSIPRSKKANKLVINWDSNALGLHKSGKLNVEIPAIGDFKILQTQVFQQPEQYVSVVFSDPLDKNQNLNGLVYFPQQRNPKFVIEGNELKIFPSRRYTGKHALTIEKVRNSMRQKLQKKQIINLIFEDVKPEIALLGKGVILPNNEGIKFPFKAINLKAVKVKVIKIYEENVAQFLQINNVDGQREIRRVGRTVHQSIVDLKSQKDIDYGTWNTFAIQLDNLINPEPGAIYRVELSFSKKQSMYTCEDTASDQNEDSSTDNDWDEDQSFETSSWDYYDEDDYYYYDNNNYDYSQRDNPCNKAFYRYNTTKVSRNILASDLGIIAKMGANQKLFTAVTDLRSTEPISGVSLEVLNYQQKQISKGTTNTKGLAELPLKHKPYLLIASKGKQKGYVRLDNNSSLSTSKFDVSGSIIQKGIKGFIYGERGVWRPGDTLFLNFMLQDKDQLLPQNHPVTFQLLNPDGQIITSKTKHEAVGNIYNFTSSTLQDAPTGNWMARVKVGGSVFSKRIKIETVKPNRLKVNLDFGTDQLSVLNTNVKGTLSSRWLHGAIAKNLKANVRVSLTQAPTKFPKYTDYIFDDPGFTFKNDDQNLFDGRLNAEGKAPISSNLKISNNAPGMLRANFSVKVFEEGGDFSVDRFSIPYAPYKSFVGVQLPKGDKRRGMLLTDIIHPINIATVNPNGKPVDSKVKIDIYKIEWRYWWEKNNNEDLSNYIGSSYKKPIHSSYATTKNGSGIAYFEIKEPEWGRYYVRVTDQKSGHTTGKIIYVDWPGWAGRASKDNPGGASMLVFSTDKPSYNVGEAVKVSIPTSDKGRALVSIESGSKVIETYWVDAEKENTQFSFVATEEMTPNVFINVTLIQPHNYKDNDLPIRLYGITPINVEDATSKITPTLKMPDELHPNAKVSLQVGEQNGKNMEYTIAVVDEGLLDITRFKTPNPWNTFYAREALGVRSWDMYQYVMGAYTGEISGLLQIGGDAEFNVKKEGEKANRFKPVVKFLGPFSLKKGQKNTHSFTMPQYVGSVKTMIIASSNNAYGTIDKVTPVTQPLMVLATLPRVISPTEKLKIPVTVFAMDKNLKNVSVEIKTNELVHTTGSNTKKLHFEKTGDQLVTFDLDVAKTIGNAKVEIIARSGNKIAKHSIDVEVRLPNPPLTKSYNKVINPNESWETNFELSGIKSTNKAYLEVSSIPAINLEERLQYLIKYPHGCVEQTTSAGFPQLFLSEVMELSDNVANRASNNVSRTINKLVQFQNSEGGFAYWPNRTKTDDWATSYVGHFLLEAKNKGFAIPLGMINKWGNYQKSVANSWKSSPKNSSNYYRWSDMQQAYRLYTLALANKAEMGAMNRLKESETLSLQALWRLAAAYAVAGQKEIGKELIFGKSYEIPEYKEMGYSYGSNTRDKAMILETLILLDEKEKAAELLKSLANELNAKKWMSTQTTAYSLIAVSKFITGNKSNGQLAFSYTQNGNPSANFASNKPIFKQALKVIKTSNTLNIKNNNTGVLFARVVTEGVPVTKKTPDSSNDLQMKVTYLDLENKPINPNQIKQGTDFKVEVQLKNPGYKGDYKQMALTQLFPSGWEIQNIRMDKVGEKHLKSTPDYMDVRDDRIHYYFDLKKGATKTFVSLVNASYLGNFYMPSITCEAMYDNTINATKGGSWTEVKK